MRHPWRLLGLGLASAAAIGCAEAPTRNSAGNGEVGIQADLTDLLVAGLVVEVTAADIPAPLVFNLPIVAGIASATITVPAGSERTIAVTGLDAGGTATHRGSTTVDIVEGTNPQVSIVLLPLDGSLPVEVTGDGLVVTVDPAIGTIDAGENIQLAATVTDPGGTPQNVPVTWGSTNPLVATVDASGLVTGEGGGTAEIVANAGAASGMATIVVGIPPFVSFALSMFDNQALDLDAGTVHDCDATCPDGLPVGWDIYIAYNAPTATHSVVVQNTGAGVEIAHLVGATFESVTAADAASATFSTGTIAEVFDTTRVILIRTDLGSIYKLGNPVEDATQVTFDAQLLTGS